MKQFDNSYHQATPAVVPNTFLLICDDDLQEFAHSKILFSLLNNLVIGGRISIWYIVTLILSLKSHPVSHTHDPPTHPDTHSHITWKYSLRDCLRYFPRFMCLEISLIYFGLLLWIFNTSSTYSHRWLTTNLAGLLVFFYGWGTGFGILSYAVKLWGGRGRHRLFICGLTRFHGRYRNGLKITRVYKSLGLVVNINWAQQYFNPLNVPFCENFVVFLKFIFAMPTSLLKNFFILTAIRETYPMLNY